MVAVLDLPLRNTRFLRITIHFAYCVRSVGAPVVLSVSLKRQNTFIHVVIFYIIFPMYFCFFWDWTSHC